jgi:D-3-phosphoglycerate dehydrogenase
MLNQFTNVFSAEGINIAHLTNQSRGDYSYCIFDIDAESNDALAQKLSEIDGVLKVRVIR